MNHTTTSNTNYVQNLPDQWTIMLVGVILCIAVLITGFVIVELVQKDVICHTSINITPEVQNPSDIDM